MNVMKKLCYSVTQHHAVLINIYTHNTQAPNYLDNSKVHFFLGIRMKISTSTFKASRLEVLYCDLVEYCLVGADEAPLDHLLLPVRVEDGVAHVEQLALVGHVRVVAVPGHVSGQGHVSRSRRTHPRPSQLNSSTMFSRMESASATSPSSDCLCSGVV